MTVSDPAAFDHMAADYDRDFTRTRLGRWLRARVWDHLDLHFQPGDHVLELACGTGEDALHLAQRGVKVTATDGSEEMVRKAREKVDDHDVQVVRKDLAKIGDLEGPFDGVFSNFGGLNVLSQWKTLGWNLGKLVRPGGKAVMVPMGPYSPWEVVFYLLGRDPVKAFRRIRGGASFQGAGGPIPIHYPSPRRLIADLAKWFEHLETHSLELALPPTYLGGLVDRHPGLFRSLSNFERRTAHLTRGWGDHYIAIFRRKG